LNYSPVNFPDGVSGYLWRPVLASLWRQRETFDGTYTIHDLIEVNQVLDVHEENTRRAHDAQAVIAAAESRRRSR
jgi:hypothetical protein